MSSPRQRRRLSRQTAQSIAYQLHRAELGLPTTHAPTLAALALEGLKLVAEGDRTFARHLRTAVEGYRSQQGQGVG